MNDDQEPEPPDNEPSLRQRLHSATGDRDAEAQALADRSGEDVDVDDAKVAVQKAHGESIEPPNPERDMATVKDAQDEAGSP